jgi:CobQ-like glutamine amidotransferase family enzyme
MKLLHLYHDLMNLYGDYANMSALCRILSSNGIDVALDKKSLGDEIDFAEYDFIYIGSGSEENQKLALSHLAEYAESLKSYIENGGVALFTGNAFEMLGEEIKSFLGEYKGLGIFSFKTTEQNKTRNTSDVIFKADFLERPLVGFVNKCSEISGVENAPFEVLMGLSNQKGSDREGVIENNFYGTHLTGPVLVKNPHFLKFLAEKLVGRELSLDAFKYEAAGYEITLEKLAQRMEK